MVWTTVAWTDMKAFVIELIRGSLTLTSMTPDQSGAGTLENPEVRLLFPVPQRVTFFQHRTDLTISYSNLKLLRIEVNARQDRPEMSPEFLKPI
jgi:hypothetical protein